MQLHVTEEWFRKRSEKEGDLEIGVGIQSYHPLVPKAYDNCTCSCHRGSGIIHFVACCAPAHPTPSSPSEMEQTARARSTGTSWRVLASAGLPFQRRFRTSPPRKNA